jgi:hypothetical protein
MTTPRPVCVHCGDAYGSRATTDQEVRWPLDGTRPPYKGNGIVIKEGHEYKTTNRATAEGVTMMSVNPDIRAKQEATLALLPEKSEWVSSRTIWDGQSWRGGYNPFCTLRCALDYARKAYRKEKRQK